MRNKFIYIFCFGLLVLISSCKKEDDAGPSITRNDYLGQWLCTENNGTSFTVIITAKGDADTIIIDNFSNYGSSLPKAMALVNGSSLNIPNQNITITGINILGTGVMNSAGTKITMNYRADNVDINATYVR